MSKSSYEYKEQNNPEKDPKRLRDSDGRVKSELKNITSNPHSKVDNSYFKFPKHVSDPYDRAHKMELERNRKNK